MCCKEREINRLVKGLQHFSVCFCVYCVLCDKLQCSSISAALFFYRDPSFIAKMPIDIAVKYMHTQEKERMEILKAKVQEKYRVRG